MEKPKISINTERGIINIKSWEKREVKVVLKLVAKNTSETSAREELDLMKYSMAEKRGTIFISNRMIFANEGREISSVIRAEYEIFVPEDIDIIVNNRFGNLHFQNIAGNLQGDLFYCDATFSGCSGALDLNISTGDFLCTRSILEGNLNTRHANISISETSGKLDVKSEYGSLRLVYGAKILHFRLEANATDVLIDNSKKKSLGIEIDGSYCPMRITETSYSISKAALKSTYQKGVDQKLWQYYIEPAGDFPTLRIKMQFGTLNLM